MCLDSQFTLRHPCVMGCTGLPRSQLVNKMEKKLGMDIDGDGTVGGGNKAQEHRSVWEPVSP